MTNNLNMILLENRNYSIPLISAIIISIIIYRTAFKNGNYTCDNLIVNTYLYVILSLVLFHIFMMYFSEIIPFEMVLDVSKKYNINIILLITFAILFAVIMIFNYMYKNIVISHIILLLLVVFAGFCNSFLYTLLKMEGLYEKVILTVVFIFILFTFLFYKYKEILSQYINDKFYIIVIFSVLLVCIIEFILIFTNTYSLDIMFIISSFIIGAFIYILLYHTKKLSEIKKTDCEEALKNCNSKDKKNCNPKNYPAYPQKSWRIFNAIVVLFQNIAEIFLGRKKNRRIGRSRIGRSRGRGRGRGRSF